MFIGKGVPVGLDSGDLSNGSLNGLLSGVGTSFSGSCGGCGNSKSSLFLGVLSLGSGVSGFVGFLLSTFKGSLFLVVLVIKLPELAFDLKEVLDTSLVEPTNVVLSNKSIVCGLNIVSLSLQCIVSFGLLSQVSGGSSISSLLKPIGVILVSILLVLKFSLDLFLDSLKLISGICSINDMLF